MVRHWRTVRESGWRWRAIVNGTGAVFTFVVLTIVVVEKFGGGAYLVVILIPSIVALMLFINRQYRSTAKQLAIRPDLVVVPTRRPHRAIVPVPGINRAVVQAVNVARSISPDTIAVFIAQEMDEAAELREQWERQVPGVPLVVVESPYRALTGPLLAYLDVLDRAWPDDKEKPITFVVIPEFVARTWWERILYNQSVRRLRTALLGRPHTGRGERPVPARGRRRHRGRRCEPRSARRASRRRRATPDGGRRRTDRRAAVAAGRDVRCASLPADPSDGCGAPGHPSAGRRPGRWYRDRRRRRTPLPTEISRKGDLLAHPA